MLHERKWRESFHVLNFVIHQIFFEFLQPLQDFRTQRVSPFFLWFLLICFSIFIGLVNIWSPRSLINRSWHSYWKDVTLISILSFSILNFTYCRWRRRSGRECWAMTPLSGKCPRSWWVRSRRRIWQAWNHNKNEVLRVALYPNPVLNEMWFLTVDPFIRISVFIAKLSERQNWWRVFGHFQSRIYPILWHTLLSLHASALLHWRLWLS